MRNGHNKNRNSQAAIFARLWETKEGKLPRTLARLALKTTFPPQDLDRMHLLVQKNRQGTISANELEELDSYIAAGDLLALLQSKARKTLKIKKSTVLDHG